MMMHQNFQPSSPQKSKQSINSLRRGKWTIEEESYVARVIQDFNSGYLNAPAGTTLRSYLSDKLHCDPMRITKKFTGDSCIGKRVFHPAVRCPSNTAAIDKAQVRTFCFDHLLNFFIVMHLTRRACNRLNLMPWKGGGVVDSKCNSASLPRKQLPQQQPRRPQRPVEVTSKYL